LFLRIK